MNTQTQLAQVIINYYAATQPGRVCLNDELNPCWNDRATDVVGKHWGLGDACPLCFARALITGR